jgi:hypothetical protein
MQSNKAIHTSQQSHTMDSVRVRGYGLWVMVYESWVEILLQIDDMNQGLFCDSTRIYTCMCLKFFTVVQSLPLPCARSSPKAIAPHQAENPCSSSEPLDQEVGSVSIMLEPLLISLI